MPGAFPDLHYRRTVPANRRTKKHQLTRARNHLLGRTLFFGLDPFCYPFLEIGLGVGEGDACACDQGHRNHLVSFAGDGLGLAAPFRWPDIASNRLSIKLLRATGRLAGSGGVGEGVAVAWKFGS